MVGLATQQNALEPKRAWFALRGQTGRKPLVGAHRCGTQRDLGPHRVVVSHRGNLWVVWVGEQGCALGCATPVAQGA